MSCCQVRDYLVILCFYLFELGVDFSHHLLDNIADAPPIAERNFRARIVVKLDDARIAKLAALSRATNTNLSEVFRSIIIKGVSNG